MKKTNTNYLLGNTPLILLLATIMLLPSNANAEPVALLAGQLIDGVSNTVKDNVAIIVNGERIEKMIPFDQVPTNMRRIDLGQSTVLPGLIDAHSHPLIDDDDYQTTHLRRSSAQKALIGMKHVQANLQAGWTTLRIAGDADTAYAMMDVRKAIDSGLYVGPRIVGAAHYISITGGGGDINFSAPEQRLIADGLVVDGVDEMRKAVREEIKHGSDWIKLLVTGAFMSAGDSPRDVHLSPEELDVAMAEAKRLSTPVMAHAHAAEGIKQAVLAGARSIEHGSFIDAEAIRLMKRHGTFLIPTMYVGDYYVDEEPNSAAQEKMIELSRKTRADFFERIGNAIKAGVKVGVGSDFGGYPAHLNAREFKMLIEAGMTPMQAIKAGTQVNAELLQLENDIGTLTVGKYADIIAVNGNPLEDIRVLEEVSFVMKSGQVVKALTPSK